MTDGIISEAAVLVKRTRYPVRKEIKNIITNEVSDFDLMGDTEKSAAMDRLYSVLTPLVLGAIAVV